MLYWIFGSDNKVIDILFLWLVVFFWCFVRISCLFLVLLISFINWFIRKYCKRKFLIVFSD